MKLSEERKRRLRTAMVIMRGVTLAMLAFAVPWSLVYWLSAVIRKTLSGAKVEYGTQLISLLLSLCLFVGMAFLLVRLLGARRTNIFLTLSEAMKRIARGDFSVTVPVQLKNTIVSPFHEVATNLNQMAESLKQLETMRQEFISDVSHEIQSPLTLISGFARALHDKNLNAEKRDEYLDIIEAESRRLSRLSDSLLKLTALDARTQPSEPTSYRLDAQLRSVVLNYEPQWSEKGIEMVADLDPISVTADEAMLSQVWGNLVHNAVKFTPVGGRIELSLHSREGRALVRISDSGKGISSEDLPFIFDRFFKVDKSRTVSNGGSGLGLSIASKIVALHGGTITADSSGLGHGTTFCVSLPPADALQASGDSLSPNGDNSRDAGFKG